MKSNIAVAEMRCEWSINPAGIDADRPRFNWILHSNRRGERQTAYQVCVASSEALLQAETPDQWDSGKVVSDQSANVRYQGRKLSSGAVYFWKVRCWDSGDRVTDYCHPATFEMGLLDENQWQGQWIGADKNISSPLLRKEFKLTKEPVRARTYISGLGWYELYLNGRKVGDHVLDPATTDYDRQILYATYDVTDFLLNGSNAVGVMLGNGWYCAPSALRYGDSPRLLMQMNIEFIDGTEVSVISDETWKISDGPIRHNDLYGGERYDARLEKTGWPCPDYNDADWRGAIGKASPGGKLRSQVMPAIKVNKTIEPVEFTSPQPNVYVYDMGRLFGGWARLQTKGRAGTEITIKYSSRLSKETGLVEQGHYQRHHWFAKLAPGPNETDVYILKGDPAGEVYEPRFTYHPVRYVQIEGSPETLQKKSLSGRIVHSSVDLSGAFHCSNPLLNQIHQNTFRTLTNELYGIPLDCLHREPWAWTDPATIAGTLYTRQFMPLFWEKWLRDIQASQDERGMVPCVAPRYNVEPYEDTAWALSYPLLVWYMVQYYGDAGLIAEHYSTIKKLVNYIQSLTQGHIVTEGILGDHLLPGHEPGQEEYVSSETPPALVWTGYYYRAVKILAQAADLLGHAGQAQSWFIQAESIREAFNEKWLDRSTCQYATGSQTANLFPLALGIVPPDLKDRVLKNVADSIKQRYDGHLHTGNTGTTCLIDVFSQQGYGDLMYDIYPQPG